MTRFCAVTAPALMLLYGVLRFFDGLDDVRGGWLWDVGHVAFFVAMILFAVLALRLRTPSALSNAATAAVLIGAACFLWVIAGDLSEGFQSAAPLPGPLQLIGPLLFQFGLLTLLVLRRLPWWSPALVLGGFVALAVNLDLLPLASLLVWAGLAPLAVQSRAERVNA
ncbi:hypothetical protein [Jidongwangia harbinensis]|uniref:hypothetical protein n=1 Tax=Jidongwangia harbinensis TaxID=2878561 RepID=UPI001CD9B5AF|nr:hypothetical protein [Jidongwangia harbinensis]MCA2216237.1 hypothetical protein [Jidongwangia harbinensis]